MSTTTDRADAEDCCSDATDRRCGRIVGAEPPLRWWLPAAVGSAGLLILIFIIAILVPGPGPLDDPDPADQRNGLVLDGPRLPSEIAGVEFGGSPVVILFERSAPTGSDFEKWRSTVTDDGVRLTVAIAGSASSVALGEMIGMPTPVDGGPPVGYAVVDSERVVRYATLDPKYLDNAYEVDVLTGASS